MSCCYACDSTNIQLAASQLALFRVKYSSTRKMWRHRYDHVALGILWHDDISR